MFGNFLFHNLTRSTITIEYTVSRGGSNQPTLPPDGQDWKFYTGHIKHYCHNIMNVSDFFVNFVHDSPPLVEYSVATDLSVPEWAVNFSV